LPTQSARTCRQGSVNARSTNKAIIVQEQ
jgi:hypothetical protein